MTQEELDALMSGDIGDIDELEEELETEVAQDIAQEEEPSEDDTDDKTPDGYAEDTSHHWPLPATDENKMVHQLDDVTKESEEKASEIFDLIENVSNVLMEGEEKAAEVVDVISSNNELFATLIEKFPEIQTFKDHKEKGEHALDGMAHLIESMQNSGDDIMTVMDIMQYQDIHRQKIERVINVMRALSSYMNQLFAGKIADEKRVTSAVHLPGDNTEDVVSSDDIEDLLASFGKK